MSYLLSILLIGGLIFFHELGHLLAAWSVRVPVERFSVGFGPVLWSRRWRGVQYCVSAIPLGGYVMPRIETQEELLAIAPWRRIVLWLGGPVANFVGAAVGLAIIQACTPPATVHGLLVHPWVEMARQSLHFVAALPQIFLHPNQLSGVVGIVSAGGSFADGGLVPFLRFAVLLNLNLAIFNLLPIAPLDGGKILCTVAEMIHPRAVRWQNGFALVGLALLLAMMAYTTVLDVVRQFA